MAQFVRLVGILFRTQNSVQTGVGDYVSYISIGYVNPRSGFQRGPGQRSGIKGKIQIYLVAFALGVDKASAVRTAAVPPAIDQFLGRFIETILTIILKIVFGCSVIECDVIAEYVRSRRRGVLVTVCPGKRYGMTACGQCKVSHGFLAPCAVCTCLVTVKLCDIGPIYGTFDDAYIVGFDNSGLECVVSVPGYFYRHASGNRHSWRQCVAVNIVAAHIVTASLPGAGVNLCVTAGGSIRLSASYPAFCLIADRRPRRRNNLHIIDRQCRAHKANHFSPVNLHAHKMGALGEAKGAQRDRTDGQFGIICEVRIQPGQSVIAGSCGYRHFIVSRRVDSERDVQIVAGAEHMTVGVSTFGQEPV